VDAALHRRRAEGLVIGGTSAGAAMMSGPGVTFTPSASCEANNV
jgi:cyanophycinase-like exopeptidase